MKIFKSVKDRKEGRIQMPVDSVGKFYIRECDGDIITFKEVK